MLGESLAKVIMVKVKDGFVMTVLPSTWKVDLKRLKDVFQARRVRFATEEEFQGLFPDCDLGTMLPFGNLHGLAVYVGRAFAENEEIIFQAGTYREAPKMRYHDFTRLVGPAVEELHQPSEEV